MIARNLSEHFIAGLQIPNVSAYLFDSPGNVGSQNLVARLSKPADPGVSGASEESFAVGAIDGRRNNPDENFAVRGSGLWNLLDTDNIRRAILGTNNRPHSLTRIHWSIRSYFKPSFVPAESISIDWRMRRSRVSDRFAVWIQTTKSRRFLAESD